MRARCVGGRAGGVPSNGTCTYSSPSCSCYSFICKLGSMYMHVGRSKQLDSTSRSHVSHIRSSIWITLQNTTDEMYSDSIAISKSFHPCVPLIIAPMDLSITGVHTLDISFNLAYMIWEWRYCAWSWLKSWCWKSLHNNNYCITVIRFYYTWSLIS